MKKNVLFKIAVLVLCIGVLAVAMYKIVSMNRDYAKSEQFYKETNEAYVTIKEDAGGDQQPPWYSLFEVDFENLQKINPEIVGWLYFENLDISYPILQGEDNEKYLHQSFTGETFSAGSLFLDCANASDFGDLHSIIYGHNMKNLSMFGKLKWYKTEGLEFVKDNLYFQILTKEGKYRYEIVNYKDVSETSDIYTIFKPDSNSNLFTSFVKNSVLSGSHMEKKSEDLSKPLVTLSTCTASDTTRFVVTGQLMDSTD